MKVRVRTTGEGYESVEVTQYDDGSRTMDYLPHHRVLAYAWGELESPFFSDDPHEIHHKNGIPDDNRESNISAMTVTEHKRVDEGRARLTTPWERQLATDGGVSQ